MLYGSDFLLQLQQKEWYNGEPFCIYGDPPYPVRVYRQAPYRTANLTANQQAFNEANK